MASRVYVNSLACVKSKGRRVSVLGSIVVRDGCIIVPLALLCIYGRSDEGKNGEEGREWR